MSTKQQKIAIICNSTNPDLVEYFKCKILSLEKSNLKKHFLILKNKKINLKQRIHVYNISYTEHAFFDKKIFLDFFKSFYIFFILLKNKVKIVHFTTAHISNIFLSILLKPFRIKQIFTIHDLTPHPNRKAIFIKMYNSLVINFLGDEIISFSKKEIAKQKKRDKFKYFTLSGFKQKINEPKVGNKIILFFGRIENYKGLPNLLDIIRKCNEEKINYNFIIAGKGTIKNIHEFKQLKNIEIINRFLTENEVYDLFMKSTFVILPYDSATQSGVIILSYSYATPVISYDVGALNEYIFHGKTGFLVKYRANNEIVKLLKKVTKKDIELMSKNCIKLFSKLYSKEACVKQYSKYYSNLMKH